MSLAHPPAFVAAVTGSSETTGRLAGFPVLWRSRLERDLRMQPEAVGPVILYDLGHGGWTSADVLGEAPVIAALKPNFILYETGDINDCFVSGGVPAVSRAQKITNMNACIALWQAAIPGVQIVVRLVNPVSAAVAVGRPDYDNFQADTAARAGVLGLTVLDTHTTFPSPLPEWMSFGFDGLHPVWPNVVEVYAYRQILFAFRQAMAAFWGLAAPVAPTYPAAADVNYELIGGGGAGGDQVGGGGGAGGILRGVDVLANLLGAFSIGAAGVAANGQVGGNGGDTVVGAFRAFGGAGGGFYSTDVSLARGRDGGSGGGAASGNAVPHGPGLGRLGQGMEGGFNDGISNGGAGGGGGCVGPGANGLASNGGAGGLGWQDDVPGDSQAVCGGGPGGAAVGTRSAYGLGGGPSCFGGGGRGGGDGTTLGAGDNGGVGRGVIWYPGAPRCAGGTITTETVDGVANTVHHLTGTGTLA